ncbi:phage capsid protein [uncultured Ruegeria sp.]|uniref:phage capsid protein n=1 Tax=uncultured Ruegeria sp. TaxID=259304 RepID=UPI00262B5F10|nr:phage capsid protein [uncultured Ruegeria sp.]
MSDNSKYEGYADDFVVGYELALQQKKARFRDKVKWAKPVKADGAQVVDHILPFEAEVGGDDLGDTKWTHPNMMPRWAFPISVRVTVPVTTTDKLSMLADPSNDLTASIIAAQNRALDGKIVVPAFFRDVVGGKDKDKVITFDPAHVIDQNEGGNNSGINRTKIDAAIEMFHTAEVDLDEEMPWMAVTPRQERLMRNFQEVKNKDFEKMGGVIEKGRVTQFLGMQVFISTRLNKVKIGNISFVEMPIWVQSGVAVQPWLEPTVKISERSDKNYTVQLFCEARYGAIRTEEGRVIKVLCNEEALPA